jgi:twitching motility protein PilT
MAIKVGLIGRLAIQQRMITRDQLRDATREQGRHPDRRLGEILVSMGYLDEAQLGKLLAAQSAIETGEVKRPIRRETPMPMKRPVPEGVALAAIALKKITTARPPDDEPPSPTLRREAASAEPRSPQPSRTVADEPASPQPARRPAMSMAAVVPSAEAPTDPSARANEPRPVPMALPRKAEARPGSTDTGVWLDSMLADAAKVGASDVFLQPGKIARLRRFGRIHDFTDGPIAPAALEKMLADCLDGRARDVFAREGQACFAYESEIAGRYRVSVYHQLGGCAGVFHRVPSAPPSFEELGLPSGLAKLTTFPSGMLLIAGPTCSGKSATIGALVNIINDEREEHILTIDHTIECVHPSKVSLISQIEVGAHATSVASAVRHAVREDSDVIVIDALSDPEAMHEALAAADGGHLVIAGMATLTAVRAIEVIIDAFPTSLQPQACAWLASSLRAVVAQRLMPTRDEKSCILGLEVLYADELVCKHVREHQLGKISGALQNSRGHGSRVLDDSLARLVRAGHISIEVARANALNPNLFRS